MSKKKNQIKIELLEKGDDVIHFSENRIVVKKKSGEIKIFTIQIDDEGLPRINEKSVLITFGSSKKVSTKIDNGIEVGTF